MCVQVYGSVFLCARVHIVRVSSLLCICLVFVFVSAYECMSVFVCVHARVFVCRHPCVCVHVSLCMSVLNRVLARILNSSGTAVS